MTRSAMLALALHKRRFRVLPPIDYFAMLDRAVSEWKAQVKPRLVPITEYMARITDVCDNRVALHRSPAGKALERDRLRRQIMTFMNRPAVIA